MRKPRSSLRTCQNCGREYRAKRDPTVKRTVYRGRCNYCGVYDNSTYDGGRGYLEVPGHEEALDAVHKARAPKSYSQTLLEMGELSEVPPVDES